MWPDHYDYAAKLNERLDVAEETTEIFSAKAAVSEEETTENINSLEGSVRFGLMEYGGFVRNETLDWQQRSHMLTVNARYDRPTLDGAETREDDESVHSAPEGATALLDHMRADQGTALF